jgi:hypothetical protein
MTTAAGDIAITRPDGLLASYAVPGQPERLVALKRREISELITEELRRMDADNVFEHTVKALLSQDGAQSPSERRSTAKSAPVKTSTSKKASTARKTGAAPRNNTAKKTSTVKG